MRYRVKVRRFRHCWHASCPSCRMAFARGLDRDAAIRWAARHAATCSDLHWANWDAACRSCKPYGRIAPACPVCLGRGWEAEREGLS